MNKILPVALVSFVLAACGGNKPENGEIEDALNGYFERARTCLPLVVNVQNPLVNGYLTQVPLGAPVMKIVGKTPEGKDINQAALRQMDYLSDEGFYKKAVTTEPLWKGSKKTHEVATYTLTEDGGKQTQIIARTPNFCVGRQQVTKIHWFTDPVTSNKQSVLRVTFDTKFVPEKWLAGLLKEGGLDKLPIKETHTKLNTGMVKTDDGWKDAREVRNQPKEEGQ